MKPCWQPLDIRGEDVFARARDAHPVTGRGSRTRLADWLPEPLIVPTRIESSLIDRGEDDGTASRAGRGSATWRVSEMAVPLLRQPPRQAFPLRASTRDATTFSDNPSGTERTSRVAVNGPDLSGVDQIPPPTARRYRRRGIFEARSSLRPGLAGRPKPCACDAVSHRGTGAGLHRLCAHPGAAFFFTSRCQKHPCGSQFAGLDFGQGGGRGCNGRGRGRGRILDHGHGNQINREQSFCVNDERVTVLATTESLARTLDSNEQKPDRTGA